MMVRPSHILPSLLSSLLLLPFPTAQHNEPKSVSDNEDAKCPCNGMVNLGTFLHDDNKEGQSATVLCCPDSPGSLISWSFNGTTYPWEESHSSLRPHKYCGNNTLETESVKFSDAGNYTCTFTNADGNNITRTTYILVAESQKHREGPKNEVSSGDQRKPLGSENVTFVCGAYVGDSDMKTFISWTFLHYDVGVNMNYADLLPNVTIHQMSPEQGTVRSRLVIAKVSEEHYGVYTCRIKNGYYPLFINMSLIQGVTESEEIQDRYRSLVVVAVAVIIIVAIAVYVWFRCGLQISLCLRQVGCCKVSEESGNVDVMVVHGYSSSHWVFSVLLPMLEDTYRYKCFLPQRDMLAGDQVAESILKVLDGCRRVLVVVTPCLLDSPWAAWSAYSGIQAALTSPARILSIVLKEPELKIGTHEKNSLLEVLRVVRRVQAPPEFGWHIVEEQHQQPKPNYFMYDTNNVTEKNKEDNRENETQNEGDTKIDDDTEESLRSGLMLNIPELTHPSESQSPGSQRVSNMVSGSNAASRESLRQDKKDAEEYIETMNLGLQDPGSPCSDTPFIHVDSHTAQKDHLSEQFSMCEPLGRCMKLVCLGDPEQVFWQTVRLHLGPPSTLPFNHHTKIP